MKDWVSWTGNCSHIIMRRNWGALHHKFLPIACARRRSSLHPKLQTDMQTEIHTHAHNILRPIICMRKIVWLSSLSISHSDFISDDNIFQASCIVEPNFCIWSIPLSENISWVLYLTCLSAGWIITVVKIFHWCRLDADNQSNTPLVLWTDINAKMQLTG